MIALLLRPWRWQQRCIDLMFLWPSFRDQAAERGMTLEMAREAFLWHAERDRAWTSLGEEEMRRRIGRLS